MTDQATPLPKPKFLGKPSGKSTGIPPHTPVTEAATGGGAGKPPAASVLPAPMEDPAPPSGIPGAMPDPFANLSSLRLSQNFQDEVAVKKAMMTVPVSKPPRQDFVMVHPAPEYQLNTNVIELKDDRETYLITPHLWNALHAELVPVILYLSISRQSVLRVWPVKLPTTDGKENMWHRSSHEAAQLAMKHWTRITANMALGAYEAHIATGIPAEAQWPAETFGEILKVAFRDRFITTLDHPVVKRLRGEA